SAQSSGVASLYLLVQANSAASAWRTPTDRPLSTAATSDDAGTPVLWKWSSVSRAPLWQLTQFALPTNSFSPATSSSFSDDVLSCARPASSASTYRSNRAGTSLTRRPTAAIALPMLAYTRVISPCRAAGMRVHAARHAVSATGPACAGRPASDGSGPNTAS